MSGAELRLDLDELEQLKKELVITSIAFGDIHRLESFGDAVGHNGLAQRVDEFSSSWDLRRAEIVAALDTLWRAVGQISGTFSDVDGQMAAHLTKK